MDDVADQLPRPEADAGVQEYAQVMTSASQHIVAKTAEIAAEKRSVVVVDLGEGDKWLLANLFFLTWMLERWTCVTLVVFTKTEGGSENLYVACAPPKKLRQALEEAQLDLGKARAATENVSLADAGNQFFGGLAQAADPALPPEPPTWVDGELLVTLARNALTLEAVEIEQREELSIDEMRAILAFRHRYVPATIERMFIAIVDGARVSLKVAQFSLRRR